MNLNESAMLGESASPFIDEGDGLTSERERVCMLLSLIVHAGGYMMMVGAHNTVECQMHVGGRVCLLRVWQTSAPATLLVPGGIQGVLPCSPGMVNADAHNTVDAQRHVGEPYRMGVNGAHNTVGENVGAYNTVLALSCQGGRRVLPGRCIGYDP